MSDDVWHVRTLASATDLDPVPPRVAADMAQPWCNFTVLVPDRPEALPEGCAAGEGTLRREAPPGRPDGHTAGRSPWSEDNPSAYRFEVVGQGRRLRVKEFLYDWAFPALDHPALWRSETRAVPLKGSPYVLWYGTDYSERPGASVRIGRTMVELSILEGSFTDAELLHLVEGLRPASIEAARRIARTPFAVVNYWARRPDAPAVGVPIGLWDVSQSSEIRLSWSIAPGPGEKAVADAPERLGGLHLDSLARETGGADPTEWELLYSGGPERGRELRLHLYRRSPVTGDPESSDHPGIRESVEVAGRRVLLGSIDDRYGPFDALITDGEGRLTARLLSTTGTECDRAWFLAAVEEFVARPGASG